MKNKNKVMSFALALFMTISSCGFVYSMPQQKVSTGTDYETPIKLLRYIGVLDNEGEEFDDAQELITKSEFIAMAVKMLGFSAADKPTEQMFFDVPILHENSPYIHKAYEMKLVYGDPEGKLNPDGPINAIDASSIIIRALNYGMIAEHKGGYPIGYSSVAYDLGLFKGVGKSLTEELSYGNSAQLILNALEAKIMQITYVGGEMMFKTSDNQSLLSTQFNIYDDRGIVTANELVTLPAGSGMVSGQVKIGDNIYYTGKSGAERFLGYKVKIYYTDASDKNEIITVDASDNEVLIINVSDVEEYKNNKIKYIQNDRITTANVNPIAATLVNNEAYNLMAEGMDLSNVTGYFELVDNDKDGAIDLAHLRSYTHMVVRSVDLNTNTIYSKISTTDKLDLTLYKSVLIMDRAGETVPLEDVANNMVIAYAPSQSKHSVELVVFENTADITIESIFDEGDGRDVLVDADGKKHTVSKELANSSQRRKFDIGKNYKVFLNIFDEVVYVDTVDDTVMQYGYLVKSAMSSGLKMGDASQYMIYNMEERDVITVYTAKKVEYTYPKNTNISTPESLYQETEFLDGTQLFDKLQPPMLIKYRLNGEGNLASVEVPNNNRFSNGFRVVGSVGHAKYTRSSGTIGGLVLLGENTRVLMVPTDDLLDNPMEYTVTSQVYFVNERWYDDLTAYSSDPNSSEAELIIVNNGDAAVDASTYPVMMVESIRSAYDEEEGEIRKIYGYTGGKLDGFPVKNGASLEYTYPNLNNLAEPFKSELKPGDVVQLPLDSLGRVTRVIPVFDIERQDFCNNGLLPATAGYVQSSNAAIYGTIYDRKGKSVYVKYDDDKMAETPDIISDELFNLGGTIYQYDFANRARPVAVVSEDEIVTYRDNSSSASKVLISLGGGRMRFMIIYKNLP